MRVRCQWAAEPAVTRESDPSMTCPSVSSFFSLLATRLYAAVCFVFLIIGVIILIFWAEVKPGNAFFYKKNFRGAPADAAERPGYVGYEAAVRD